MWWQSTVRSGRPEQQTDRIKERGCEDAGAFFLTISHFTFDRRKQHALTGRCTHAAASRRDRQDTGTDIRFIPIEAVRFGAATIEQKQLLIGGGIFQCPAQFVELDGAIITIRRVTEIGQQKGRLLTKRYAVAAEIENRHVVVMALQPVGPMAGGFLDRGEIGFSNAIVLPPPGGA